MSLPNLYTLAQHFALSPSQAQALAACAHTPPHADWPHRLWRSLAVVAALLLGCDDAARERRGEARTPWDLRTLAGTLALVGAAQYKPEKYTTAPRMFHLEQVADLATQALEDAGVVSPADVGGSRRILAQKDNL